MLDPSNLAYLEQLGDPNLGLEPASSKQISTSEPLLENYIKFGHYFANIDPLNRSHPDPIIVGDFMPSSYDPFYSTYCGNIGFEFEHVTALAEKSWLVDYVSSYGNFSLDETQKLAILRQLVAAAGLEKYLATKYPGAKRFSIEGLDSCIPLIEAVIGSASKEKYSELVLAMAHRGRLNALVNIMGKTPAELFSEFDDNLEIDHTGDVKYHKGYSTNHVTDEHVMHMSLAFNPSHLEIVNPVMQGSVRARLERGEHDNDYKILPIIIHGDSALSGQGVVMEAANMSQTRAYGIGGTIHIVMNNQIGFTSSKREDQRSTNYCTDIAKMQGVPVLHVNSCDPVSVVYAAKLAFAYRNKFNKDIFIDLIGFRRHGHNEADEPRATQPNMYQAISKLASTGESFAKSNSFEQQLVDYQKLYWDYLSTGVLSDDFTWLKKRDPNYSYKYENQWHGFLQPAGSKPITSIQQSKFDELAKAFLLPGDLKLQPQVNRVFDNRKLMSAGSKLVDWGFAELLAYASIISDGYNVRLSGQDARRGTFAHRHSTVFDQETGNEYVPLQQIARKYNRQYSVYDSLLSEVGVLAFEYGYATTEPNTLVIWEAQFGDFVNGAQVVIDQFISAGEQKWGRLSGLTLLLPHGYEGQGPEHSSARIERFLAACAQDNLRVCQPTTSAQIFHLLREQIKSDRRRPLIVFTPKSLLRSKHAGSSITSFTQGSFNSVIVKAASYCKKVLICSGKIYYQLVEALEKSNILDFVSLIRIEEFYPFPKEELVRYLSTIPELKERIYWVQDEPKNQGAWQYISSIFVELELGIVIKYIGRELQSSPAVGSLKLHNKQQSELIAEAISLT